MERRDVTGPRAPRLLFMVLTYPHADRDGSIYSDLPMALTEAGADVRVIAPSLDDGFVGERTERGVAVVRTPVAPFRRVGRFRKALAYLSVPSRYGRALHRHLRGWTPDWLVVYTPPVTLAPLVDRLKRRYGCHSFLILHDLFPRNAVDLGMMREGGLRYTAFRWLERWYYATSTKIGVMSPANARAVRRLNPGLDGSKLVDFPLWISQEAVLDEATRAAHRSSIRRTMGLGDEDVLVVLGGNIGVPQRSEVIVELALRTRDHRRIAYCVVGDGTERENLVAAIDAANRRGARVEWRPMMPRREFQRFLSAADIGLVSLHEDFTVPNIPSRSLGYAAAGVPILAITDRETDLDGAYLRPHGFGRWAPMADLDKATADLLDFANDPDVRQEMAIAGRRAVQEHFSSHGAARRLLTQLTSHAANSVPRS